MSSYSSSGEVRGSGVLYAAMVIVSATLLLAALWSPSAAGHAAANPANEEVVVTAHPSSVS
jgi:hypothetical protein